MKWMIYLLMIFIVIISVQARPFVGCEENSSTLIHCWNNGTIETDTFFQWSDKGLQMANNNTDRFNWTTYEAGFAWWSGGSEYYVNMSSLGDVDIEWSSDNLTYYRINVSALYRQGGTRAYLQYTAEQLLNDDYVNFTIKVYTISGFHNFNKPFALFRSMKGINIDLDDDVDVTNFWSYNYSNWSQPMWYNFYLNKTNFTYLSRFNLSRKIFSVGDITKTSSSGIAWKWNDDDRRELWMTNSDTVNNDIFWFRFFNVTIDDDVEFELSEFWIDIPICSEGCPFGFSLANVVTYCNATLSTSVCAPYPNTSDVGIVHLLVYSSMLGGGPCTHNAGCYVRTLDNFTGSYDYTNAWYRPDSTVVCTSETYPDCRQNEIYNWFVSPTLYWTRGYNVSCRQNMTNTSIQGNYTTGSGPLASTIGPRLLCGNQTFEACVPPPSGAWIFHQNEECVDKNINVFGNIVLGSYNLSFQNSTMSVDLSSYYISGSYLSRLIGDVFSSIW